MLPPLPLPESVYSIQKNLKMNDLPAAPRQTIPDSLFGPAADYDIDNTAVPAAVRVVSSTSQDENATLERQASGPVVSRISVIDEERSHYIQELQEQKKTASKDSPMFNVNPLEESKRDKSPSILQPHMRKCSVYQQQLALHQECNRNGRYSNTQQRLLRVHFICINNSHRDHQSDVRQQRSRGKVQCQKKKPDTIRSYSLYQLNGTICT